MISLEALNHMSERDFATALGAIFEHSQWVAERAYSDRPFGSRLQLLEAMRGVVGAAPAGEQLALIRKHPQLGSRGGSRSALTQASAGEQHRAGLDACSAEQWARLEELNAAYAARFEMPFVLAVRGHGPRSIIENFERRMHGEREIEQRAALHEIGLIAGYRLAAAVAAPAGAELLAMREQLSKNPDEMSARLREWMHAAELDVTAEGRGVMLGRRRSGGADAETLLIGVHYESHARALRHDARHSLLLGIALMQGFQERNVRLPFDVCLVAAEHHGAASSAELGSPAGFVTLAQAASEAGDEEGHRCLRSLRAAGIAERSLALVRQGEDRAGDHGDGAPDAATLDGAVRALEQFLMQSRSNSNHPLALHG